MNRMLHANTERESSVYRDCLQLFRVIQRLNFKLHAASYLLNPVSELIAES